MVLKPVLLPRYVANLPHVAAKYATQHCWAGFKPAPTKKHVFNPLILIILVLTFSCTSFEFNNPNDPANGAVYSSSEQSSSSGESGLPSSSSSELQHSSSSEGQFDFCLMELFEDLECYPRADCEMLEEYFDIIDWVESCDEE